MYNVFIAHRENPDKVRPGAERGVASCMALVDKKTPPIDMYGCLQGGILMLKIREYGASLVALCLFIGQVHAETAPPTPPGVGAGPDTALQEIVVTAQKRV